MEAGMMETITVPIGLLRPNPVQNPARTTPTALRGLTEEMKVSGWTSPVLVTRLPDGLFQLEAGHRRTEVSKILGRVEMLCCVLPDGVGTEAFVRDAVGQRPVSNADYLVMWTADHDSIRFFRAIVRKQIETLKSWIGERELVSMVNQGRLKSPGIVSTVTRVMSAILAYPSTAGAGIRAHDVLFWMVDQGTQRPVMELFNKGITPEKIAKVVRAIRKGRTL